MNFGLSPDKYGRYRGEAGTFGVIQCLVLQDTKPLKQNTKSQIT